MTPSGSDITIDFVRTSLDLHSARNQLIAANLANRDSTGFRPSRLDFESVLGSLADDFAHGASPSSIRSSLEDARRTASPVPNGDTVQVDDELALMQMNLISYEALVVALGKLGSMKHMALVGSRG